MQQMTTDLETRRKLTEEKLKKVFKLKLFILCKTRAKKSSPDMFIFCVVLVGHDLVTEIAGLPRANANSKLQFFKQKSTKNQGNYENMALNGKTVWSFQKKKNTLLASTKKPHKTHGP